MSQLSELWSSLSDEQQTEWKRKAHEGTYWTEKPKKTFVRDLTIAIKENVRLSVAIITIIILLFFVVTANNFI